MKIWQVVLLFLYGLLILAVPLLNIFSEAKDYSGWLQAVLVVKDKHGNIVEIENRTRNIIMFKCGEIINVR